MRISDFIKVNESLDDLYGQQVAYPVSIAYKLALLRENVNKAFGFILQRLYLVLGNDVDFTNMNEEQQTIYETIASSEIDTSDMIPNGLTFEDIIVDDAKCTMSQIWAIKRLFDNE